MPTPGTADPALTRYVEAQGFDVIGEGRLPLIAQSLSEGGQGPKEEVQAGGAPYVTFVQTGGALGLSPPATFIRIPWTPRLADRAWLMDLRLKVNGLVKPRKSTWAERLIVGGRYVLTMSWNEVRDRPLFAMYFAHRDRVVPLADAPSELVVNFAHSDRLKIDQVFPPTSIRRISENLESTEVVSLFLDKSDGITPQHVSVQYGYFSSVQAWALVLVPALFFVLGQAMGPLIGRSALRAGSFLAARVHVGGWNTCAAAARDRAHRPARGPREDRAREHHARGRPPPLRGAQRGERGICRAHAADARVPGPAAGAVRPSDLRLAVRRAPLGGRAPGGEDRARSRRGGRRAGVDAPLPAHCGRARVICKRKS